jgi:hypothetical protein
MLESDGARRRSERNRRKLGSTCIHVVEPHGERWQISKAHIQSYLVPSIPHVAVPRPSFRVMLLLRKKNTLIRSPLRADPLGAGSPWSASPVGRPAVKSR